MEMIKELRNSLGLSQSEFAKKYYLSVRTLQQWEQGISKPLESLLKLIKDDIDRESNLRFRYVHRDNDFKVCIKDPFLNCEKIYPIQQRKVRQLINDLKADSNVTKIIIFGSSVSDSCHIGSDVDIYFESKSKKSKLNELYDFEYDLWNNYNVDQRLRTEILKKGVMVYERD